MEIPIPVLPWGKNLPESDTAGCIIGASLAEQLFGGTEVEGQQILYNGRELAVRGVVKEPQNIMLCQSITNDETVPKTQTGNSGNQQTGSSENNQQKSIMTKSVCSIQTSRERLTDCGRIYQQIRIRRSDPSLRIQAEPELVYRPDPGKMVRFFRLEGEHENTAK